MPVVREPVLGDGGERQGGSETLDVLAWTQGNALDGGRLNLIT